jgi:hypothetical protein
MKYAFCETVTAGGRTPWHIRKLTDKGHRYGGGADTLALCGRKVSWDVDVEITEHHLTHSCKGCVEQYRKEIE